jgi:hypothetical protein
MHKMLPAGCGGLGGYRSVPSLTSAQLARRTFYHRGTVSPNCSCARFVCIGGVGYNHVSERCQARRQRSLMQECMRERGRFRAATLAYKS